MYDGADSVKGSPGAREIIRVDARIDGWVGVFSRHSVGEREVLNDVKLSWFAWFWDDGDGG